MSHEVLTKAKKRTVGTKQTLKAVEKGQASQVYIANDADEYVIKPLVQLCAAKGVPVVAIDTMSELGKFCGIEVGCASAAILSD